MKKLLSFLLVYVSINYCTSQSLFYRNFDLPAKAPQVNLDESILKKNKAIFLNEHKAKELCVTSNNEVEYYLFYSVTILINDIDIIEKFNRIYIPVSSKNDLLNLKCRTTQPNGKSVELYKGDMKTITEDGEDYFILALEGLEKNSIIEYFYIKRIGLSYNATEYLNNKFYVKNYKFQHISPVNLVYAHKSYNGFPNGVDSVFQERNIVDVSIKDVEPVKEEKYSYGFSDKPRMELKLESNKNNPNKKLFTYADVSKRVMNNFLNIDKDDQKAINRVYKKLDLESVKTVEEKIFIIENFIKVTNGFMSNPGELSLSECIDKKGLSRYYQNKLAANLLEKCGIKFEVVLTTNKEDQVFDDTFETEGFLDKSFFFLSDLNKYFSPNDIVFRFPNIPYIYTGQKGLFIKPLRIGEAISAINSIKFIETQNDKSNFDNIDCDIQLNPKDFNKVSFFITRTIQGHAGFTTKALYFYSDAVKQKEIIEETINLGFENAKVSLTKSKNTELDQFEKYNEPFSFSGLVETTKLTETAGEDVILKIGNCIGPQAELYQEEKRTNAIYTAYPHNYNRKITLLIPFGYVVTGLEKLKINNVMMVDGVEVAYFKSDYTLVDNKLIITVDENYLKDNYKKEYFDDFRKVINAAADFNKVSLLVKKK